jgi:hypothetical protein
MACSLARNLNTIDSPDFARSSEPLDLALSLRLGDACVGQSRRLRQASMERTSALLSS